MVVDGDGPGNGGHVGLSEEDRRFLEEQAEDIDKIPATERRMIINGADTLSPDPGETPVEHDARVFRELDLNPQVRAVCPELTEQRVRTVLVRRRAGLPI